MNEELDCKDMSRLISAERDQRLPPAEQVRMRQHLVICDACRNVNDQFDLLSRAIRQLGAQRESVEPADK